ncbi:MAG: VWA domain-containing protein [Chitinophagales bacterium]|nr:VWA domain-containing protein [Chitinophagales bacterium]
MMQLSFANPQFLWLLNSIPLLAAFYVWQNNRQQVSLQLSSVYGFKKAKTSYKVYLRHSTFMLRMIAVIMVIVAAARPQLVSGKKIISSEGIDIIIALDISGSMLAKDFTPNRLEAAKAIAASFIDGRPNDRIGLVLFAGQAYTACPVTIDHASLKNILAKVKAGYITDGTAIGTGLGTAANRLKNNSDKSHVIILMTDGENNAGEILPLQAAQLARSSVIRVYTIGIQLHNSHIDPPAENGLNGLQSPAAGILLAKVAEITNGKYFRATSTKNLEDIYREIDRLEKTKVSMITTTRYEERFGWFAGLAAFAVFLELLLRYTVFKTLT